jgi:hypothetical protein
MGQPLKPPQPVKLIVAMLSRENSLFAAAQQCMEQLWGAIDIESTVLPFNYTNYYEKQMGPELLRKFVSFNELIEPDKLAGIKHQSNDLEAQLAVIPAGEALQVARPINLDPGYVEPSKLVLATTKNYAHRIYIGNSMYAEATLHYHKGKWQSWPFTYPDYAGGDYHEFLNYTRQKLMEQLS